MKVLNQIKILIKIKRIKAWGQNLNCKKNPYKKMKIIINNCHSNFLRLKIITDTKQLV